LPGKNGRSGKNGSNGQSETIAAAITEVSDRLTRLVHDEIELAKAEMAEKASSLARGAAAVAAGAVFGVFAVVFFMLTIAWVIDGIFVTGTGNIWLGFLVVLVILAVLTIGAFLFAWRKLKVGVPAPTMAIDEAKKIRETVTTRSNGHAPLASVNGAAVGPVSASASDSTPPPPATAVPPAIASAPAAPAGAAEAKPDGSA
jgi:uncharacterized membrane protein YqjE